MSTRPTCHICDDEMVDGSDILCAECSYDFANTPISGGTS